VTDEVIKGLINAVVTALVFGVIALLGWLVGGGSTRTGDGATVLRYGGAVRGLGVLMALIILGLLGLLVASLLGVGPDEEARTPILGVAAVAGVIGLPLLAEGFRRQVVGDAAGLTPRSWFGTDDTVLWQDIDSVENKVMAGKFVVRAGRGKVSLGHYLEGLDVFADECKRRLDPVVYGKAFDKPLNRPFL
jgi:hypothetical protein